MSNQSLQLAWRKIRKDRSFTLLNIIGLSAALSSALLIYCWVQDERGVDQFHANRKRLYQVMSHISLPDGIHSQEATPYLFSRGIAAELPQVEAAVAVQHGFVRSTISSGRTHIKTDRTFVDSNFFNCFSFPLLSGNRQDPFPQLRSVMLSESLARKVFRNRTDVVGQPVQWGDETAPFIVSGVFRDPPENSTLQFDLLFSYEWYYRQDTANAASWQNCNPSTYFLLKKGVDPATMPQKLTAYLKRKSGGGSPLTLTTIRFAEKYLHDQYENGVQSGGRIAYVRLFLLIGLFIILIAVINFMNLSTARADRRMKDAGVRKLIGASRLHLVMNFYLESALISFLSLVLAILLLLLLLPGFNHITGKNITLHFLLNQWPAFFGIAVVTTLLAGSYPAIYLSGFRPVSVLKGIVPNSTRAFWLRQGLVVFQYSIAVVLIVAVLVIYRQMTYIRNTDLGYQKDNVIYFKNDYGLNEKATPFMNDVSHIPGVTGVSSIDGDLFGATSGSTEHMQWPGKSEKSQVLLSELDFDFGLVELLNIPVKEGRSFSRDFITDDSAIILNQAAVRAMGIKNPVGMPVKVWGGNYHVIGVLADFHFESLYEKVKPCFFRRNAAGANFFVKMQAVNRSATLAALEQVYRSYNAGLSFDYRFIDEGEAKLYRSEQTLSALSRYAAGLAILISALGMFGMAAFTAGQRKKEFGIRKIIGASAGQLAWLLSAGFLKLIGLSLLIALPLAAWIMNHWLTHFAYHIHPGPGLFAFTAILVGVTALLTVAWHSVAAATANPVKSLRTE